jgi:NAD(P)-dependent dehydrogenase (short-subunit alcohol dehydrogenase family)
MYSKYLDSQLQSRGIPIRVNSVHPGVVHTDLYTHVGWVGYVFAEAFFMGENLTSEKC